LIAIAPHSAHVHATRSGSRFITTGQPQACGGHDSRATSCLGGDDPIARSTAVSSGRHSIKLGSIIGASTAVYAEPEPKEKRLSACFTDPARAT
jgi:hypothetical protein